MPFIPARPILLVEDNPDTVEFMELRLRRAGYQVQVAADGEAALAVLASSEGDGPALVLLDVHLPRLSGLEVHRRLRIDPRTAELPVLFITAAPEELPAEVREAQGCTGWIAKAFRFEQLFSAMDRLLAPAADAAN